MNTNIFRVLILEPLKILACLFVIRALTFKLCLKAAYLSLKVRYLTFHVGKLVLSKRKLLTEYRRRAVLGNQLLNAVENGHSVVMPNYLITRKEIPLNCYWRTNWELIPSFIIILPELTAQGGFASIPLHRLRMEHTNCTPAFGVRQLLPLSNARPKRQQAAPFATSVIYKPHSTKQKPPRHSEHV